MVLRLTRPSLSALSSDRLTDLTDRSAALLAASVDLRNDLAALTKTSESLVTLARDLCTVLQDIAPDQSNEPDVPAIPIDAPRDLAAAKLTTSSEDRRHPSEADTHNEPVTTERRARGLWMEASQWDSVWKDR